MNPAITIMSPDRHRRKVLENILKLDAVRAISTDSAKVAAAAAMLGDRLLIDASALGEFTPTNVADVNNYVSHFGEGYVPLDFSKTLVLSQKTLTEDQEAVIKQVTGENSVMYRGPDDYYQRCLSQISPFVGKEDLEASR